jgi:plasmid stability protein
MAKTIQIRGVPDKMHRTLKARAAREGMSLSDFIKRELQRSVQKPTLQEWLERTRHIQPLVTKRSAVEVIRKMRGMHR